MKEFFLSLILILSVVFTLLLIGLILYRYITINDNFFINNWKLFIPLFILIILDFILMIILLSLIFRKKAKLPQLSKSKALTFRPINVTKRYIPVSDNESVVSRLSPGSYYPSSNEIRNRCPS